MLFLLGLYIWLVNIVWMAALLWVYNVVHSIYIMLFPLGITCMHTKTAVACTCMHGFGSNFMCKLIGPICNFLIFLNNWIEALLNWFLGGGTICDREGKGRGGEGGQNTILRGDDSYFKLRRIDAPILSTSSLRLRRLITSRREGPSLKKWILCNGFVQTLPEWHII